MKSRIRTILACILIPAIFFFLIKTLAADFRELSSLPHNISLSKLVVSFLLMLPLFLFDPLAWNLALKGIGEKIAFRSVFSVYFLSLMGKYLPGRVWSFIGQMALAEKRGISVEKTLVSSLAFQAISCIASVYVFLLSLLLWDRWKPYVLLVLPILTLILGAALYKTNWLKRAMNFILKRWGKRNIEIHTNPGALLRVFLIVLASWTLFIPVYYLFINSFFSMTLYDAVKYTGIYAVAWLIGFISLLTPNGWGVREGVQTYLLNLLMPLPMAIIIAIAGRVWLTLGELTMSFLALILHRQWSAENRKSSEKP